MRQVDESEDAINPLIQRILPITFSPISRVIDNDAKIQPPLQIAIFIMGRDEPNQNAVWPNAVDKWIGNPVKASLIGMIFLQFL